MSSRGSSVPQSVSQARRVAAASADPPPMPPVTGTCLAISMDAPPRYPVLAASRRAALIAMLAPSVGTRLSSTLPPTVTWKSSDSVTRTSS